MCPDVVRVTKNECNITSQELKLCFWKSFFSPKSIRKDEYEHAHTERRMHLLMWHNSSNFINYLVTNTKTPKP